MFKRNIIKYSVNKNQHKYRWTTEKKDDKYSELMQIIIDGVNFRSCDLSPETNKTAEYWVDRSARCEDFIQNDTIWKISPLTNDFERVYDELGKEISF